MAGETVKLTIDDKLVEAPRGTNIIEAAKRVGIEVPHYCYHPKLAVVGNCRMCLVDIGMPKLGPDKKPVLDAEGKPVIVFAPVGVVARLGIAVGRVDVNHAVVRDGDSGKIGREEMHTGTVGAYMSRITRNLFGCR